MKRRRGYVLAGIMAVTLLITGIAKEAPAKEKRDLRETYKKNYSVEVPEKEVMIFNELDTRKCSIKDCSPAEDRKEKDKVEISKKQILKHFGKNIFPKVTKDLSLNMDRKDKFPVYKRNGRGKIYYDRQVLNYADKKYERHISVEVQTGEFPSCFLIAGKQKGAKFGDAVVTLFQDKKRKIHYAEFAKGKTNFHVYAKGLKRGEFVKVIDSLTKEKKEKKKEMKEKKTSYMDFTAKLLKETVSEKKNTLISPFSVFYAMGMTMNGAKENTLKELEAVFGMTVEEMNSLAKKHLKEEGAVKLANGIWFKDSPYFTINQGFLEKNQDLYKAEVKKDKFDEATLKEINAWVEKKTDGRVKNILDKMDKEAMLYLVNALAFESDWEKQYDEYEMREKEFQTFSGEKQKVKMMYSKEKQYLEDKEAKGFIKPYKGGKYAFVALLPKKGDVLSYVKGLNGKKLAGLFQNKKEASVGAGLPAFKTEFEVEMSGAFQNLGAKDAFDGRRADFSGMGKIDTNLAISRILHKTFIEVDGLGTKAGAATVVEMIRMTSFVEPEEVKEVTLDRPFVYMIVDTETNRPFFVGTVLEV